MVNVRIPQIADLKTAVNLYHSKPMLFNDDVKELFPTVKGRATITKLKQKAREYMVEHDILSYNAQSVNTEAAYAAWGLDINDLENRLKKLEKLKLL
jgi:hypothetical protein